MTTEPASVAPAPLQRWTSRLIVETIAEGLARAVAWAQAGQVALGRRVARDLARRRSAAREALRLERIRAGDPDAMVLEHLHRHGDALLDQALVDRLVREAEDLPRPRVGADARAIRAGAFH